MVNPEYLNQKIRAFVGLSPILFPPELNGLFRFLDKLISPLLFKLPIKNFWEHPEAGEIQAKIVRNFP